MSCIPLCPLHPPPHVCLSPCLVPARLVVLLRFCALFQHCVLLLLLLGGLLFNIVVCHTSLPHGSAWHGMLRRGVAVAEERMRVCMGLCVWVL